MIKGSEQLNSFLLSEKAARIARIEMIDGVLRMLKPKYVKSHQFRRFGSPYDGGYVLADDITNSDVLISYGIGRNIDFEEDILRYANSAFLYDGTIEELPKQTNKAIFVKHNVSADNFTNTFEDIIDKDLILKCDIEAAEWNILRNVTTDQLSRFRQIAIELHDLDSVENLAILNLFLNTALQTHSVVYVHPNNHVGAVMMDNRYLPRVIEVTLVRNNSYDIVEYDVPNIKSFDRPNTPDAPDLSFNLIF